jgi:FkbM family methyltransferase
VCIEPDPEMYERIRRKRRRDTVLNVGISTGAEGTAPFYLFPGKVNGWSTFSEQEARVREAESGIKPSVISIPIRNINNVIAENFDTHPNFISLDVEGLDLEILQSLDFTRFQPEVICVETISFSIDNTEEKLTDISDFMHSRGYITYADTHVNTIFARKDLFKQK